MYNQNGSKYENKLCYGSFEDVYSIEGVSHFRITGLSQTSQLSKLVHQVIWYSPELVLLCCVDPQRSQHSTLYSCKFDGESLVVR